MSTPRIAIVISHPIQHFCPQYASLAGLGIAHIKVFFASALGYKKYFDPGFGRQVRWGNLYLDKFDHEFLNDEAAPRPDKNIDAGNLEAKLNEYSPDIVILYGYYQKLQRRAHRWASRTGVKMAYISDSEKRHKRNGIWETIKYPFIYRYFSRIDFFLTVGDANEDFYKSYGVSRKKMISMHFPIDKRLYEKAFREKQLLNAAIRAKYDIPENEAVFSVVGKLVDWKSQQDIINAIKLLESDGKRYHLFLIGSGPMEQTWKELSASLANSKVYFAGFIDPTDLPSYYAASDIYIHPARVEPHSLSISEAIYMGCPVILSDTCGSYGKSDDVQPCRNGFVYSYGDVRELADKINILINDPALRNSFGKKSHELAMEYQHRSHEGILYDLIQTK